jgi:hypothetical protein
VQPLLKSKLKLVGGAGFWNSNTKFIVPPEPAICRSETEPDHEEINIGWLPSSGPFQIVMLLAIIKFKIPVLLTLTLVSVTTEPVLLVMVVNSCLPGGPETVMTLLEMEPQADMGVIVGVLVGIFVGVLLGVLVGVRVGVLLGVLVGVFVDVLVGVFVDVLVGVFVDVLVGVFVDVLVGVLVAVLVGVLVAVLVGVLARVLVGVTVCVGVAVFVGV